MYLWTPFPSGSYLAGAAPPLKRARELKARAFLGLAEPELNPNWRNFYITVAHELQGLPLPKDINGGLKAFGFWFPADGNQGFGAQGYVLHLRHG
ncbi:MAG TPA: alkyl sulfatase dimerization domain-containing protein, partial [Tahibacter sp.]|uniref:alkyl sulfatase dimerization domain-containing protein n=1 Tax=Tahibacter sp. TaxID=2056211 RepID=UPI002BD55D71